VYQRRERTSTLEFVKAFLSWMGNFGVPKTLRSSIHKHGASTQRIVKYQRIVVLAFHPQENSMAERRMKEILTPLRSLVHDYRIKEHWSHHLTQLMAQLVRSSRIFGDVYDRFQLDYGFTRGKTKILKIV